jgi:hypothetical protein
VIVSGPRMDDSLARMDDSLAQGRPVGGHPRQSTDAAARDEVQQGRRISSLMTSSN